MVRKTMIVLATAAALSAGLTDAMARGGGHGGGFGGGHIGGGFGGHMGGFAGHMSSFGGHMGAGFASGHLVHGFAGRRVAGGSGYGHFDRDRRLRGGYAYWPYSGWGYDYRYPCDYYNYTYANSCYYPNGL
jgi:hypothetical protein